LIIITLASIVPDFDSGIGKYSFGPCHLYPRFHAMLPGIASIFALAEQYKTDPGEINNLTSK
jgi:hypothetical protein